MEKMDYTIFFGLWSNFWEVVKKSIIFIFIPVSFAFLLVLQVLNFVKQIVVSLFGRFDADKKEDPTGVRVAKTFTFGAVLIAGGFAVGALDVCVFVIGLFYDLTNKLMTCGKSDTYFIKL